MSLVSKLIFALALCLFSCKQNVKKPTNIPKGYIELTLQGKVKPQRIEDSFRDAYGLKFECTDSVYKRKAIFSFNSTLINENALLFTMSKEVGVLEAKKSKPCSKIRRR